MRPAGPHLLEHNMSTPKLPYTVTSEYSDTPADVAGLMPLVGNAVERLRVKLEKREHELSGRNGSSYILTEIGQVSDAVSGETYAVTEHNFGLGVERQCICREFEPGRPCVHVRAIEAAEMAEAVA
jgi:hypothetical protein